MNKYFWLITAILISLSSASYAQKKQKKSKEEAALEKQWAKKLKALKPLDYKRLLEEKEALAAQVLELQQSNATLKAELERKESELAKTKKELEDYNSGMVPGVVQNQTTGGDNSSTAGLNTKRGPSKGVVYKVQIGSFKSKDLTKYFDNNPNFSGEVDHDGQKKYTLGVFTDYWEADKFKKALREMGVKGAWVVAYKDGKRVNIKDVLEGTI
jgi:hypothetical protein